MATLNDILNYAESLANQGVGADADGASAQFLSTSLGKLSGAMLLTYLIQPLG